MALFFPDRKADANRYVKQAIPIMVKHDIVPNPQNFALWYTYVSNRNSELKDALDEEIAENGTCRTEKTSELFTQLVIKEEVEKQEHLQESLFDVMHQILTDIDSTRQNTTSYASELKQSLENLHEDSSPEKLQKIVEQLITSTQNTDNAIDVFRDQIMAAEMEIQTLRERLQEAEKDVYIDALTKLANRRAFDEKLYELIDSEDKISLVMLDLDHFKSLNDNYGHQLGDKVLASAGQIMQKLCPEGALAARYGGEEFAFIVKGSAEQAFELAEKTRLLFSKLTLKRKNSAEPINNITASFGVAEMQDNEFPENLLSRADKALYDAKESGRNQTKKAA